MSEYIYESTQNGDLNCAEAIIVLPDIYCQTNYSKKTVEDFALNFRRPVFMLDYFYLYTGKANNLDNEEREKAHELMQNLDPKEFTGFFEKALREIKEQYPKLNKFTIIGFCFGGRLAYIAGTSKSVSGVVSFYGGGANNPDYVGEQSAVEYLISKKGMNVSVTSFFGTNDTSIPEDDRQKVKEKFTNAGIDFGSYEYDAGHAYFQEGRKNYNRVASQASWEILKHIFNG